MKENLQNKKFDLNCFIERFVEYLSTKNLYNEACIQHELGYFLRKEFEGSCSYNHCFVEFERNIKTLVEKRAINFIKKEIDLLISSEKWNLRSAIELKYTCKKNGRVPEMMFDFCKDINFLEQLRSQDFDDCYFFAVNEKCGNFNSGKITDGIYKYFREDKILEGCINKPTGAKDKSIALTGSYKLEWKELNSDWEYLLVKV